MSFIEIIAFQRKHFSTLFFSFYIMTFLLLNEKKKTTFIFRASIFVAFVGCFEFSETCFSPKRTFESFRFETCWNGAKLGSVVAHMQVKENPYLFYTI